MSTLTEREQAARARLMQLQKFHPELHSTAKALGKQIAFMTFGLAEAYRIGMASRPQLELICLYQKRFDDIWQARGEQLTWEERAKRAEILWALLYHLFPCKRAYGWRRWLKNLDSLGNLDVLSKCGVDGATLTMLHKVFTKWQNGETPSLTPAASIDFWEALDEGNESEVPLPYEPDDDKLPEETETETETSTVETEPKETPTMWTIAELHQPESSMGVRSNALDFFAGHVRLPHDMVNNLRSYLGFPCCLTEEEDILEYWAWSKEYALQVWYKYVEPELDLAQLFSHKDICQQLFDALLDEARTGSFPVSRYWDMLIDMQK